MVIIERHLKRPSERSEEALREIWRASWRDLIDLPAPRRTGPTRSRSHFVTNGGGICAISISPSARHFTGLLTKPAGERTGRLAGGLDWLATQLLGNKVWTKEPLIRERTLAHRRTPYPTLAWRTHPLAGESGAYGEDIAKPVKMEVYGLVVSRADCTRVLNLLKRHMILYTLIWRMRGVLTSDANILTPPLFAREKERKIGDRTYNSNVCILSFNFRRYRNKWPRYRQEIREDEKKKKNQEATRWKQEERNFYIHIYKGGGQACQKKIIINRKKRPLSGIKIKRKATNKVKTRGGRKRGGSNISEN